MPTVIYCDRVKHKVHQDAERIEEVLRDEPTFIRVTPIEGALPGVRHVFLRTALISSFHAMSRSGPQGVSAAGSSTVRLVAPNGDESVTTVGNFVVQPMPHGIAEDYE